MRLRIFCPQKLHKIPRSTYNAHSRHRGEAATSTWLSMGVSFATFRRKLAAAFDSFVHRFCIAGVHFRRDNISEIFAWNSRLQFLPHSWDFWLTQTRNKCLIHYEAGTTFFLWAFPELFALIVINTRVQYRHRRLIQLAYLTEVIF